MFISRDNKLTNDPLELYSQYKKQKDLGKVTRAWYKGDDDAQRLIKRFFEPEFFLKRVIIAYHKKLKLECQKSMSLFGFYLNMNQKNRMLNMIDKKPIYRKKH